MNQTTIISSHETLHTIIYNLLDSGHITWQTEADLISAVNNSPSQNIY